MKRTGLILGVTGLVVAHWTAAVAAAPLGTAVSYQGRLKLSGVTVDGACDLEFRLFDAPAGGTQIGPTLTFDGEGGNPPPIAVVDGLLAVELNFGSAAFHGDARWLQIAVACPPGGALTTLAPRQAVTPSPYALALGGMRTTASDDAGFPDSWNVVGGYSGNLVGAGVAGATISGGGSSVGVLLNRVLADFGTIGGGRVNSVGASDSTVAGGVGNTTLGQAATVSGGNGNFAGAVGSIVAGGISNVASGQLAIVGGGRDNEAGGDLSFAVGRRAKVRTPAQVGGGDFGGDEGTFIWADSTDADFMSSGPNQFLIRASGGVGIGTSNPLSGFHLYGGPDFYPFQQARIESVHDGGTWLHLVNDDAGGTDWSLVSTGSGNTEGAGSLVFYDGSGGSRMLLDPDGNVGIGTSGPAARLHVLGGPSFQQARLESDDIGGTWLHLVNNDAGGTDWSFVSTGSGNTEGAGALLLYDWLSGPRLLLDASGRVGIGTTVPAEKLAVNGNILLATDPGVDASVGLPQQNAVGRDLTIQAGGSVSSWASGVDGGKLVLRAGHANRSAAMLPPPGTSAGNDVEIIAGDNVFTLAAGTVFNGNILFKAGDGQPERLRIVGDTGSVGIGTSAPSEKLHVVGNIRTTGSVFASCGTLICSDSRYKTNVKPVQRALELVEQLRPVSFDWKREQFPEQHFPKDRQLGLVAQEVQKVAPEVVQKSGDGYLAVDYGRLTPLLAEAVKELSAKVKARDDKIAELNARLERIEKMLTAITHSEEKPR